MIWARMILRPRIVRAISLAALSIAFFSPAFAVETGGVSFHGSLSSTVSYSNRYDYLGDTSKRVDPNITELTLNGGYRFKNGLRLTAQLYAYELADYNDLAVDFASLDYSFGEKIGVRVGRNKQPYGLYGDSQDLDMLRPFAFLPFGYYDKTMRSLAAAVDGVSIYGTLPVGSAGTVDYQLFGGYGSDADFDSPFFVNIDDKSPSRSTASTSTAKIYGVWAAWNTPVPGLRIGSTYSEIRNIRSVGIVKTAAEIARSSSDVRRLPGLLPPGLWNGAIAGRPSSSTVDMAIHHLSAEYTRGAWQFAVEGSREKLLLGSTMPVLGSSVRTIEAESYYGMATWQIAPRLQLGTYYGISYSDRADRRGRNLRAVPAHTAWLKDLALAASYTVTDWWLVKVEGHLLDGTNVLSNSGNGDAAGWKRNWNYFSFKTTVSF